MGLFHRDSSESDNNGGTQRQKVLTGARCDAIQQEESGPEQRQSIPLPQRLFLRKAPITPFMLVALSQMTSGPFHFF